MFCLLTTFMRFHLFILIAIGGWKNKESAYLCDSSDDWTHRTNTTNILDSTEDRSFFVTFSNDTIEVGRDGEEPFLIFQPSCSLDVKYLGIASGFGSSADWTFCGYCTYTNELKTITVSFKCVIVKIYGIECICIAT